MLERIVTSALLVASLGSGALLFGDEAAAPALAIQTAGDPVSITRSGDGLFHVQLELDGRPLDAVVDTGATRSVVNEASVVAAAGNTPAAHGAMLTFSGRMPYRLATIKQVRLAGRSLGSLDVAAISARGVPNVVGQDFIGRLGSVTISGDRMELKARR
jgi:aspartyl protease family protein